MPTHNSGRVEFAIDSGHIEIVSDKGQKVPAYWAHPRVGKKFSGICLLHDWWGLNDISRILVNFFAQMGYYVIAPDMYLGELAHDPKQAMKLLDKTKARHFDMADTALTVLEKHHRTNSRVAAVGLGMGGTLAFEAAIKRKDLEASVAYASRSLRSSILGNSLRLILQFWLFTAAMNLIPSQKWFRFCRMNWHKLL